MSGEVVMDFARVERVGVAEAVYGEGKSTAQLAAALADARATGRPLLLTRLSAAQHAALADPRLDYDPVSRTAMSGRLRPLYAETLACIVTAGASDLAVAREAARTLHFHGEPSTAIYDVGVAGLWRLEARLDEIRRHAVVIAIAGMEGALFSVLGGLVPGVLIALPSARGHGVAAGGRLALDAALASCAPGIVAVNVDGGFQAAAAALRVLAHLRGR